MALDGIFLSILSVELKQWLNCRVDKIQQISKLEIVLNLSKPNNRAKLLISANSSSARINFTNEKFQNPKNLPFFCASLRKHLLGARLIEVKQIGFDRIIFLKFKNKNEIGDWKKFFIVLEIMGKHSNIFLLNEQLKIIDFIKKNNKNFEKLIKIQSIYCTAVKQNKLNILNHDLNLILNRIVSYGGKLSDAILATIEGISKVVAFEIAFSFELKTTYNLNEFEINQLLHRLEHIKNLIKLKQFEFFVWFDDYKPKEFCWFKLKQYDGLFNFEKFSSASELLEFFYCKKATIERVNQRCYNITKKINDELKKVKNKKNIRLKELSNAENCDEFKKYGDLLMCNLNKIKKGDKTAHVVDFYNKNVVISINLCANKSPLQNAQHFYKKYRKAKIAKTKLQKLILDCDDEIKFLNSELDLIMRAETEHDVLNVLNELINQNYYKKTLNLNQKKNFVNAKMNFLKFKSSDGFEIWCGRNNYQNDFLTTKKAKKTDVWLHVKNFSGSHVVVFTKNDEISQIALKQAAIIAAFNSSLKNDTKVAVDYVKIKHVKKPNGSRPGMVVFTKNKTIYVQPDEKLVKDLKLS